MEYVTLSNGIQMPQLGYGVYQTPPEDTERCVTEALEVGYRSIDTAQVYGNEAGVGAAIAKCGIDRSELFITTKVWYSNSGYEKAKASIEESLKKLQTDYVDLLLIHQPFGDYYSMYRAIEDAYREGKVKALGVSNFYSDRLVDIANFVEIPPMVNQVETHVFWQQKEARPFMDKYDVRIESWGPLAQGNKDFFNNAALKAIGGKYGKTISQTALRFLLQEGIILIPKTVHRDRMEENFNIFDFSLDKEDMEAIRSMDEGKSLFFHHETGETAELFMSWI